MTEVERIPLPNKPGPAHIYGSEIAKGLQIVEVLSSTATEKPKSFGRNWCARKKTERVKPLVSPGIVRYAEKKETFLVQFPRPTGAIL